MQGQLVSIDDVQNNKTLKQHLHSTSCRTAKASDPNLETLPLAFTTYFLAQFLACSSTFLFTLETKRQEEGRVAEQDHDSGGPWRGAAVGGGGGGGLFLHSLLTPLPHHHEVITRFI